MVMVIKGQVTFDAEGNDIETSKYFSRLIHWPGDSLSGVTIGRGYDMGNRTKIEVQQDMVKAGVLLDTAKALSEGAGLKGIRAKDFVDNYKDAVGKITHVQQIQLFNNIYPYYEVRAEQNYNRWTAAERDRVEWNRLDQAIRDVLVDFVYQGFTRGPNPMKAGMNNDFDELIKYIQGTASISRYEPGRHRAQYLMSRKPVSIVGVNK